MRVESRSFWSVGGLVRRAGWLGAHPSAAGRGWWVLWCGWWFLWLGGFCDLGLAGGCSSGWRASKQGACLISGGVGMGPARWWPWVGAGWLRCGAGGVGDSFVLLPGILGCWGSFARAFLPGRLVISKDISHPLTKLEQCHLSHLCHNMSHVAISFTVYRQWASCVNFLCAGAKEAHNFPDSGIERFQ